MALAMALRGLKLLGLFGRLSGGLLGREVGLFGRLSVGGRGLLGRPRLLLVLRVGDSELSGRTRLFLVLTLYVLLLAMLSTL